MAQSSKKYSINPKLQTPENLTAIFKMFFQGDESATRGSGGLGIGLTLTKRLLEMHRGDTLPKVPASTREAS